MIVFTPAFWLEIQGSAAVIRALTGRTYPPHTPDRVKSFIQVTEIRGIYDDGQYPHNSSVHLLMKIVSKGKSIKLPEEVHHIIILPILLDGTVYWETQNGMFAAVDAQTGGQMMMTQEELSRLEMVLGSKCRSGEQTDVWFATYGPAGEDGYPKPLWDKATGKIDHKVADYMRDNGYDLVHYMRTHWARIGKHLVGKLHFYAGDMDHYYLNLAVYLAEEFLETTKDPYYAGSFAYGRPMKGHTRPVTISILLRQMADEITKNTPAGESAPAWKY